MTTDSALTPAESLDEGGTWLLDLVAAVDHLRRGLRPGITVWDALDEALRWTTDGADEIIDLPDPLAASLAEALVESDVDAAATIQTAIRRWVLAMADRYNDGHHWPHPAARRGFPPPSVPTDAG
jgi:hypothetical protein